MKSEFSVAACVERISPTSADQQTNDIGQDFSQVNAASEQDRKFSQGDLQSIVHSSRGHQSKSDPIEGGKSGEPSTSAA